MSRYIETELKHISLY